MNYCKNQIWFRNILPAVCMAAVMCGCGEETQAEAAVAEHEVRVTLQPLEKRLYREQIPVQGTVEPVEYAVISAKVSGTLERLCIDEGDALKAGTVLFETDRKVLENYVSLEENELKVKTAALNEAKITLGTARINYEQAAVDFERYSHLYSQNATSLTIYEQAETAYKKAQMDVKKAEAVIKSCESQIRQVQDNLLIAKKNLADTVLKAPYDCVVTDCYAEEKEYVQAGQSVLRLESPAKMEVVCYISAVHYTAVEAGKTAVEFSLDGKNMGKSVITYKAPNIDPDTRTFKIKAVLPADSPLVSGMLCCVSIILREKEAYGLPGEAILLRSGDRRIAYTINSDGRAESVDIQTGISDGRNTEILNFEELLDKHFVVSGQTFVNNGTLLRDVAQEKSRETPSAGSAEPARNAEQTDAE